jgi:hypothetical protein
MYVRARARVLPCLRAIMFAVSLCTCIRARAEYFFSCVCVCACVCVCVCVCVCAIAPKRAWLVTAQRSSVLACNVNIPLSAY